MAMRVKPKTGEDGLKQRYRVTNWSAYYRALVNRGNLTICFDDESVRANWTPPVERGKPWLYHWGMPESVRAGLIAPAA